MAHKNTIIDFEAIYTCIERSKLSPDMIKGLITFYQCYEEAIRSLPASWSDKKTHSFERLQNALLSYISYIEREVHSPFHFSHFHERITSPIDYFQFGLDMVYPLLDEEKSVILGTKEIPLIEQYLEAGDNVIFLANHQAEIDPQIISILLAPFSKKLSEELICIAGHRVTQDPLAIPFSLGRSLLCIYSKKYIDHPPEQRPEKVQHNAQTMQALEMLLQKGGTALYVAPSGGRDRIPEDDSPLVPSPFDSQSVEMFRLLSTKSSKRCHFFLLALKTIDLLPPPQGINISLGEERRAQRAKAGLFISEEINLDTLDHEIDVAMKIAPDRDIIPPKQMRRRIQAELLTTKLQRMYQLLLTS